MEKTISPEDNLREKITRLKAELAEMQLKHAHEIYGRVRQLREHEYTLERWAKGERK